MSGELTRVGVVDVGSNSVRLVVFDGISRSPAYFYNEKVLCGLGAGLAESGHLNPEGRIRALAALRRFAALTEGMGAGALTGVATAAVREARDGPEFTAEVLRETGIELQDVLSRSGDVGCNGYCACAARQQYDLFELGEAHGFFIAAGQYF